MNHPSPGYVEFISTESMPLLAYIHIYYGKMSVGIWWCTLMHMGFIECIFFHCLKHSKPSYIRRCGSNTPSHTCNGLKCAGRKGFDFSDLWSVLSCFEKQKRRSRKTYSPGIFSEIWWMRLICLVSDLSCIYYCWAQTKSPLTFMYCVCLSSK